MYLYYLFTSRAQHNLDFRHKSKVKITPTIVLLPYVDNHFRIRENEHQEKVYNFFKIDYLIITTWNSIRNIHPFYYKKHIPNPMLATGLPQLIYRKFEEYNGWSCNIN